MLFDVKNFNPNVFGKYVSTIPNTNLNELYKSKAIKRDSRLKALFNPQTGSYKGTLPYFGRLSGKPDNYDGGTDINATTPDTYIQEFIVTGRAKGFLEKDFSSDITGGVPFMDKVAAGIAEYWAEVYQAGLLSVLKGIFAMTGTGNADFVSKHTYDISASESGNFGATTLNSALQKASGDSKSQFSIAFMHSKVATDLENLQLLEYLKYTDKAGIQRNLTLATLNGRIVIVDDGMPSEIVPAVYTLTADTDIDTAKTYYTRSGSADSYVYTAVKNPVKGDIGTYYEKTAEEYEKFTTYVLGEGAITLEDVGAEVPYEMDRNPAKNGGETTLYTRRRYVIAPDGISFVGTPATKSPTDEELETGSNWSLISNGQSGANKVFFPHKKIAIAKIVTL